MNDRPPIPADNVRQDCPECGGSGLITSGVTYGGHEEFVGCPFCRVRGES